MKNQKDAYLGWSIRGMHANLFVCVDVYMCVMCKA